MGIANHAGMHKREFERRYGYVPNDYGEVREALNGDPPEDGTTLDDYT